MFEDIDFDFEKKNFNFSQVAMIGKRVEEQNIICPIIDRTKCPFCGVKLDKYRWNHIKEHLDNAKNKKKKLYIQTESVICDLNGFKIKKHVFARVFIKRIKCDNYYIANPLVYIEGDVKYQNEQALVEITMPIPFNKLIIYPKRKCGFCGKTVKERKRTNKKKKIKMRKCSKCEMEYYCNQECQKRAWNNVHRLTCSKLQKEMLESYNKMIQK